MPMHAELHASTGRQHTIAAIAFLHCQIYDIGLVEIHVSQDNRTMLSFLLVLLVGVLPASTFAFDDASMSTPIVLTERSVNFDASDATSYNTSASDSQITADVGTAESGLLEPHSGNSFL